MEESIDKFTLIYMVQYMNIALILVFADFSLGSRDVQRPILFGKYRDFDTSWYYDVGAKISFAMVTNSISPMVGKVIQPAI